MMDKSAWPYQPEGHQPERRHEPRHYLDTGQAIDWQPLRLTNARHPGWLHDASKSGISFLTRATGQPRLHDEIAVFGPDPQSPTRLYRIVRVDELEAELSLVACRKSPSGPQPPWPGLRLTLRRPDPHDQMNDRKNDRQSASDPGSSRAA